MRIDVKHNRNTETINVRTDHSTFVEVFNDYTGDYEVISVAEYKQHGNRYIVQNNTVEFYNAPQGKYSLA